MYYLTHSNDIRAAIAAWKTAPILWLDTEIADWQTSSPRLSLIQVLSQPDDRTGAAAFILDVLDQPDLIQHFIQTLMVDLAIEKVFHNAPFDLRYLGQAQAQNVTCTLKLARRIGKAKLGTSNLKLKTLAAELCQFTNVDAEAQSSDWGQRDLSSDQLHYAAMDVVYLAAVHRSLLQTAAPPVPKPTLKQPVSTQPIGETPNVSIMPKPTNPANANPADSLNPSLSPTKIRTAFECPRLFYLGHRQKLKTLFIPKGDSGAIGKPFHDLADQLITYFRQDTDLPSRLQSSPGTIANHIQQQFYQQIFFPYLQNIQQTQPSQAPALLTIWQGIRSLIQKFADLLQQNRPYYPTQQVIQATFPDITRTVEYTFTLPDGSAQKVSGAYDCLIFNAKIQRLCVIELKTYAPIDPTAQLAQVALYSYLLHRQQHSPIDAAVYCVLPEFQAFDYAWEQLESSVHQLIPHKLQQMQKWLTWEPNQPNPPPQTAQPDYLCPMCSQQTICQTAFEPTTAEAATIQAPTIQPPTAQPSIVQPSAAQPPSPAIEPMPTAAAKQMGQTLITTFAAFGVETRYEGAAVGPAFIRIKLKPQLGVKVSAMTKLADDLRVQLGLAAPPLIAPQSGYVSVDLPRLDRQTAHFAQYVQAQVIAPDAPIKVAIGIDLNGQLCEADLSDSNTCHFLVGGTTGSGKSEFLRSLLLSLLAQGTPEQIQIILVDPKRVTFPEFEQMPWLYAPIVKDAATAIDLMQQLVDEMESRYRQFEQQQCNDLPSYNRRFQSKPAKQMPRIVCIFDEYADFMAEKEIANDLQQSIKRLGAMARAPGFI